MAASPESSTLQTSAKGLPALRQSQEPHKSVVQSEWNMPEGGGDVIMRMSFVDTELGGVLSGRD